LLKVVAHGLCCGSVVVGGDDAAEDGIWLLELLLAGSGFGPWHGSGTESRDAGSPGVIPRKPLMRRPAVMNS